MINMFGQGMTTHQADDALMELCESEKEGAKQLNLAENVVEHVPHATLTLTSLEALWMQGNMMKHMGHITMLVKLRLIDLSQNRLEEVPREIKHLELLEELYLRDNLISELPREMMTLEELAL